MQHGACHRAGAGSRRCTPGHAHLDQMAMPLRLVTHHQQFIKLLLQAIRLKDCPIKLEEVIDVLMIMAMIVPVLYLTS